MESIHDPKDILEGTWLEGGMIRHTIRHPDGSEENVSLNNILAACNRLSGDIYGNRFLAQIFLPESFWEKVLENAHSGSIFPEIMSRDKYGGVEGLINQVTIYHGFTEFDIVVHVPQFDLTWVLTVGPNHQLIAKTTAFELVGPNKGFDLIVPYHPALGYAPPRLLAQWVDEGYKSAEDVEQKIAALPPSEKLLLLAHWEELGYNDSRGLMIERGLAAPKELLQLEGSDHESKSRRALPQPRNEEVRRASIDGEFTILSNRE